MLKITVIIPTSNRAKTLLWCLKTCVEQDYENYEIIVSDNFSKDNTYDIVKNFNDERIKYIKTDKHLSMHENWEFALNHVKEGYVMIMGDDDGLVPYSLKQLANLINKTKALAIRPYPITYYWPFCAQHISDGIILSFENNYYTYVNSIKALENIRDRLSYFPDFSILPGLYHGFVHIDIINKIRKRDGKFFNSNSPDTYSDVIVSAELDKYVLAFTNICINGASKYSTGVAYSSIDDNDTSNTSKKNFHGQDYQFAHKSLERDDLKVNLVTNSFIVAEAFLQAKDRNKNVPDLPISDLISKIIKEERYGFDDKKYYDYATKLAENIAIINNMQDFFYSLEKSYRSNNIVPKNDYLRHMIQQRHMSQDKFINVYTASLYIKEKIINDSNSYFNEIIFNDSTKKYFFNELITNLNTYSTYNNYNLSNELDFNFFITNDNNNISDGYFVSMLNVHSDLLNQNDIEWLNCNVDKLIVNSMFVKLAYKNKGINENIISIVKEPIDLSIYREIKHYKLNTNKNFKFLYVNTSDNKKGISMLIESFSELFNKSDDIVLFIKDISNNPSSIRFDYNTNTPEIIIHNEFILPEEIGSFYNQFDCYINPYMDNYEITSMLESLALGNRIITIDSPIVEYTTSDSLILVSNDENDLYLADKESLKKAILSVVNNKIKYSSTIEKIQTENNINNYLKNITKEISSLKNTFIIRENLSIVKSEALKNANEALNKEQYENAEKLFNTLHGFELNNNEYIFNFAFSKYMQGKYDDAIDILSNSLENNIIDYNICNLLAKSIEKSGDNELAELFYKKADELKKDSIN